MRISQFIWNLICHTTFIISHNLCIQKNNSKTSDMEFCPRIQNSFAEVKNYTFKTLLNNHVFWWLSIQKIFLKRSLLLLFPLSLFHFSNFQVWKMLLLNLTDKFKNAIAKSCLTYFMLFVCLSLGLGHPILFFLCLVAFYIFCTSPKSILLSFSPVSCSIFNIEYSIFISV